MQVLFKLRHGLSNLSMLFENTHTNEIRRSKGAPIIRCVTTKIPTWGYHQLVIFTPSRIPIMVPSGGNGEWPPDLDAKWTINHREMKRGIGKRLQTITFPSHNTNVLSIHFFSIYGMQQNLLLLQECL
jgi:hypothetical protein